MKRGVFLQQPHGAPGYPMPIPCEKSGVCVALQIRVSYRSLAQSHTDANVQDREDWVRDHGHNPWSTSAAAEVQVTQVGDASTPGLLSYGPP